MGHQPTSAAYLSRTVDTYILAANQLAAWLESKGHSTKGGAINPADKWLYEVAKWFQKDPITMRLADLEVSS